MIAFLSLLQDKYGGAEGYVTRYAGLSDNDITTIRNNLLIPATTRL